MAENEQGTKQKIWSHSIFGALTRKGLVGLTVGDRKPVYMSPEEARSVAADLLQAATAARDGRSANAVAGGTPEDGRPDRRAGPARPAQDARGTRREVMAVMSDKTKVQIERLAAIKARHANGGYQEWAFDDIAWLVNRADERDELRAEVERLTCEYDALLTAGKHDRAALVVKVDDARAEVERLRAAFVGAQETVKTLTAQRDKAEAEVERLRAALEKIATADVYGERGFSWALAVAQEALGEK